MLLLREEEKKMVKNNIIYQHEWIKISHELFDEKPNFNSITIYYTLYT